MSGVDHPLALARADLCEPSPDASHTGTGLTKDIRVFTALTKGSNLNNIVN
jgi:hypothetical protein